MLYLPVSLGRWGNDVSIFRAWNKVRTTDQNRVRWRCTVDPPGAKNNKGSIQFKAETAFTVNAAYVCSIGNYLYFYSTICHASAIEIE
jgi:hypothetical protein